MSTAIRYVPIGTGEFTKELLDSNFSAIGAYTMHIDQHLSRVDEQIAALWQAVEAVAKQIPAAKKPSLLKYALIGGLGYYAYTQLRRTKVNVELNDIPVVRDGKVDTEGVQRLKNRLAEKRPANETEPTPKEPDQGADPAQQ